MKEIIEALQKEVYKLDFKIGQVAEILRLDSKFTDSDIKLYDEYCAKRRGLVNCLQQLRDIDR